MSDLYDEFWADAYDASYVFAEWVDTADDRGAP